MIVSVSNVSNCCLESLESSSISLESSSISLESSSISLESSSSLVFGSIVSNCCQTRFLICLISV